MLQFVLYKVTFYKVILKLDRWQTSWKTSGAGSLQFPLAYDNPTNQF